MVRHLMLYCSFVLVLALPSMLSAAERGMHETDATTVCETALPSMREAMATLKQGRPLTSNQEAVWRDWNRHCRHASWQQALAEGLPPVVRTEYPPNPPLPPPSLTWRDYAVAAIKGLERGATAPVTSCRTTRTQRGKRASYYTTCNTY